MYLNMYMYMYVYMYMCMYMSREDVKLVRQGLAPLVGAGLRYHPCGALAWRWQRHR